MKCLISRAIIENDGVIKVPVAYYTDAYVFQEQVVHTLTAEGIVTNGLFEETQIAILTHSTTNGWGMVASDIKKMQSNSGSGDFLKGVDDTDDITVGENNNFVSDADKTKLATLSLPLRLTLVADQATGANVTPLNLSDLTFAYEANSVYRIFFMGRIQPGVATTGCGFQFDLSTAVTDINLAFYHQLANSGTLTGGHSIADDASVGVSSGAPGTGTYPVVGHALLRTGASAGTAQLRIRSETTAVITAKAGMVMIVEKIA